MPWKETGPVQERAQLVALAATGMYTVSELARHFGISRKTAHKWLSRAATGAEDALLDRSRAPHGHPNATPAAVVQAVLAAKLAHRTWGPLKLLASPQLPAAVAAAWPAPSTRGAILARAGLTSPRRRRRRAPPSPGPLTPADAPNTVWCADFKGWFRTGDGQRCDPLTISDAHSRFLLCCQGLAAPTRQQAQPIFERVFREYGLPLVLRTDNGPPFASLGAGGLSRLGVWWVKLGILPERIQPGHPEQNGRHERLHRTLKADCLHQVAADLPAQQAGFEGWRQQYNTERPHQALGLLPPASRYLPSPRAYPTRLEDPVYPDGVAVRRVRSNGQIKWHGHKVFVGEAVIGEAVGVLETDQGWLASFGPVPLGLLDPITPSLQRLPPLLTRVTYVFR